MQATECGDRGVHRSRPLRGLGNVEMDAAGRITVRRPPPCPPRRDARTQPLRSATIARTWDAIIPRAPPLTSATFPINRPDMDSSCSMRCGPWFMVSAWPPIRPDGYSLRSSAAARTSSPTTAYAHDVVVLVTNGQRFAGLDGAGGTRARRGRVPSGGYSGRKYFVQPPCQ